MGITTVIAMISVLDLGTGQAGPACMIKWGRLRCVVDTSTIQDPVAPLVDEVVRRAMSQLAHAESREPWMKLKEAEAYASCSAEAMRSAIKSGHLRGGRVGTDYRTRRSYIDEWLLAGAETPSKHATARRSEPDPSPRTCQIIKRIDGRAK